MGKESFRVGPITSSNEEIAVVDENGLTAKQKGKVQIIATYQGKKTVFPAQVKG